MSRPKITIGFRTKRKQEKNPYTITVKKGKIFLFNFNVTLFNSVLGCNHDKRIFQANKYLIR